MKTFGPGRWSGLLLLFVALLAGCSGASESTSPGGTSRSTSAPAGSTMPTGTRPAAVAIVCNGANEVNQDDDGAVPALLQRSQLPPGDWKIADTPPCPWALSADELLAVPECLDAANAAANDEARNGNGRVTYALPNGVQLDDRIEIYTSRQNVDAIRAVLGGPSMTACFTAALKTRATTEPGTTISNVNVDRFVVPVDAAALGLGFPASNGYAADAGFVEGVQATFTKTSNGASAPVTMRVVSFGAGGLMSTVTVIGSTPADLDAFDLTGTLRAAAKDYKTMTGPG